MINANFFFHPVGQGAFYTGEIRDDSNKRHAFKMVYDCGSLSKDVYLKSAIEDFKYRHAMSPRFHLDVLFLSHLDDDHVNGVKYLLKDCNCGTIYLPYMTPVERLYVALRHSAANTPDYDDYLRFLTDPVEYFSNIEGAQINRIVYIRGNSEGLNEENIPRNDGPLKTDDIAFELKDNLAPDRNEYSHLESKSLSGNVEFKQANNAVFLNNIWEFYMYHEPGTYEQLYDLKMSLENMFDWFYHTEDLHQDQLKNIFNDKNKLAELRKIYKKLFKSHNKSGLVLQHKPLGYRKARLYKDNHYHYIPHYYNYYPLNSLYSNVDTIVNNYNHYEWGVTLLTGDICMNQIQDSYYIKSHLRNVSIFQVPHHGSANGWSNTHLSSLEANKTTTVVINFGYGNRYGHPHPDVLESLNYTDFDIRFCNQFEGVVYTITIE